MDDARDLTLVSSRELIDRHWVDVDAPHLVHLRVDKVRAGDQGKALRLMELQSTVFQEIEAELREIKRIESTDVASKEIVLSFVKESEYNRLTLPSDFSGNLTEEQINYIQSSSARYLNVAFVEQGGNTLVRYDLDVSQLVGLSKDFLVSNAKAILSEGLQDRRDVVNESLKLTPFSKEWSNIGIRAAIMEAVTNDYKYIT